MSWTSYAPDPECRHHAVTITGNVTICDHCNGVTGPAADIRWLTAYRLEHARNRPDEGDN